jgi:hypothetical protein
MNFRILWKRESKNERFCDNELAVAKDKLFSWVWSHVQDSPIPERASQLCLMLCPCHLEINNLILELVFCQRRL